MNIIDSYYDKLVNVVTPVAGQVHPLPNPIPFVYGLIAAVVVSVPLAWIINHL